MNATNATTYYTLTNGMIVTAARDPEERFSDGLRVLPGYHILATMGKRSDLDTVQDMLKRANAAPELAEALREVTTLFNDKGQWIGGPDATQNEMLPRWQALLTKATGD